MVVDWKWKDKIKTQNMWKMLDFSRLFWYVCSSSFNMTLDKWKLSKNINLKGNWIFCLKSYIFFLIFFIGVIVFTLWSSLTSVYFNFAHFICDSFSLNSYSGELDQGNSLNSAKEKNLSCFHYTPPQNWTGFSHFLTGRAEKLILAKHKKQNPEPVRRGKATVKAHECDTERNRYAKKEGDLKMCMVCRCYSQWCVLFGSQHVFLQFAVLFIKVPEA